MPGEVLVITAPSGTGKTTLLQDLLAGDPLLKFSISYTTRTPRPGEASGRDYFFVSDAEFQRLKDQGALMEWVEQFGYSYGTSREWVLKTLEGGTDLVFDLDSRGARVLKREFPQGTFIFILPPTLATLRERLEARGDLEPTELARRLAQSRDELKEVSWYDYVVINDDLSQALEVLRAIVTASRHRTARLWPEIAPRFLPPGF